MELLEVFGKSLQSQFGGFSETVKKELQAQEEIWSDYKKSVNILQSQLQTQNSEINEEIRLRTKELIMRKINSMPLSKIVILLDFKMISLQFTWTTQPV